MVKRKRKGIRLYSFIAPTLVILSVLLLNGLATRIEFPEACETEPTKYRLNIPGICDEMIVIQQSRGLELNLETQPFSDVKTIKLGFNVAVFTEILTSLESKSNVREMAKSQKNI